MSWLLIIISVIFVWVASLFKIRQASCSSTKTAFLNNGEFLQRRNVLLVVAHPDDESMFFSPTITFLNSRGHNLHLLCMSTGNADGMGNIRKEELYQASAVLKIPPQQVKILDHPDLQDGFGKVWDHALLAKIIEEEVIAYAIDMIITFDDYGVSGHCNHIDVHRGLRMLLHDASERNIEAWELLMFHPLPKRKYALRAERAPSYDLSSNGPTPEPMGLVPEAFHIIFQLYLRKQASRDQIGSMRAWRPQYANVMVDIQLLGSKQGIVAEKCLFPLGIASSC